MGQGRLRAAKKPRDLPWRIGTVFIFAAVLALCGALIALLWNDPREVKGRRGAFTWAGHARDYLVYSAVGLIALGALFRGISIGRDRARRRQAREARPPIERSPLPEA